MSDLELPFGSVPEAETLPIPFKACPSRYHVPTNKASIVFCEKPFQHTDDHSGKPDGYPYGQQFTWPVNPPAPERHPSRCTAVLLDPYMECTKEYNHPGQHVNRGAVSDTVWPNDESQKKRCISTVVTVNGVPRQCSHIEGHFGDHTDGRIAWPEGGAFYKHTEERRKTDDKELTTEESAPKGKH